ncbi:MAG: bifunctional alpha,alpha-trehalose-phosphate synthase (UDP-forming)/trehalose-phosphatase [Ignavibacteriae bacterium]|nr:bifunctional alpha,alpha-trehalose-phosphate synthase (UDP-forming)/trehalose-phosphatase [Ignavibacteriota bacterium]
MKRRILIVSNRLPVSITKSDSGLEYKPSAGGLATGLSSLHAQFETLWIGWPGEVPKELKKEVENRLMEEHRCYPVFLPSQLVERYYEGFSNRTVWPIFHSLPSYAKYSAAEWEAYKKANLLFSQKILQIFNPGDILWIHDYHLMLVPKYLREHLRDATMGFFLHIPFPHYDIFRLLPQHKEILESLLALDLIGFHTHDYAQAFLGSVRRLLGLDNTLGQLFFGDHMVQADVFPMGIDFEKYATASSNQTVQTETVKIQESVGDRKMVLSISRLDYTKGIPESLEAIEEFFDKHSEWREKVVFVLVVVPSREKVERYAALKHEIDELVGRINSAYGTLQWQPIHYIYRSLNFEELTALYGYAHVAMILPLRDGMNLIAKEYLAAKQDEKGVLLLSEMAGAAKELLEAIIVNPNSKEEIAHSLSNALQMPDEEQRRRNKIMRQRLQMHNIDTWVKRFFDRLTEVENLAHLLAVKVLDSQSKQQLLTDYSTVENRLIMLDYDGTLVPFADEPIAAKPDAQIISILKKLSSIEQNHVVVLSGRDRETLEKWLGDLHLTLVAEHGGWVKPQGQNSWDMTVTPPDDNWKKDIRPVLELFVSRIPGSCIEEKFFSLVWHYRTASNESASIAARELLDTLSQLSTNLNIQVLPGNKILEVRNAGISKGMYYLRFHSANAPKFILAIGDDWTDEDLFSVLPPQAYSIKVAPRISKARFNLRSVNDVRALLEKLATLSGPAQKETVSTPDTIASKPKEGS